MINSDRKAAPSITKSSYVPRTYYSKIQYRSDGSRCRDGNKTSVCRPHLCILFRLIWSKQAHGTINNKHATGWVRIAAPAMYGGGGAGWGGGGPEIGIQ